MSLPIAIEDVTKRYRLPGGGRVDALRGVGFAVEAGDVLALLGPNGSGKSTTLKVVLGLTTADAGRCTVFGLPPGHRDGLRRIGFLPEDLGFFENATGLENLRFLARLSGLRGVSLYRGVERAVERAGVGDYLRRPVRTYSRGMRQALGLAQALLHDPELLILDEPTTGFDPIAVDAFRVCVSNLRREGRTIVLCTHALEHVAGLCNRLCILDHGRVVARGTPESLAPIGAGSFRLANLTEAVERRLQDWARTEGVDMEALPDPSLRESFRASIQQSRGEIPPRL